jgi:hypothetical protein
MVEIFEHLNALENDLMGGASLQVGDKTDAASIVLKPRIIKPLFGGPSSGRVTDRLDGGGGCRIIHNVKQAKLSKGRLMKGKGM